jgi:hypothetical protein
VTAPPPPDAQPGPVTLATVLGALNATVGELTATKAEVKALKGEAQFLRRYGKHNRLLIWAAAVGLALDIAATVIAGYALASLHHEQVKVQSNAATIAQLRDNNLAACQTGNKRLIQQEKALDAILTVGGPPQTPQARQFIAKAEGFVASGWGPRECSRLYPLPSGH